MSDAEYRIVRGNPTDEETAALVAVVAGLAAAQHKRKVPREIAFDGGWKSYWRTVRSQLHPGQESWRGSGRN